MLPTRPSAARRFAALLLLLLLPPALAGTAAAREVGQGDLRISQGLLEAYARFQELPSGLYFAVSTNGWAAGYSVCRGLKCTPAEGKRDALKACRQSQGAATGTCYIFGDRDEILWNGKIIPTVRGRAEVWG